MPSKILEKEHRLLSKILGQKNFAKLWRRAVIPMIRKAATEFTQASEIVTSRLHGYIMARLLDCKVTLVDNSYGKNSRYVQDWHR
jgi:pyruvyl transferase EpsO